MISTKPTDESVLAYQQLKGELVTAVDRPAPGAPDSARSRRRPGTGFPVVSLPEAAKIVRDAGKYGFEHSVSSFARYMGHSTTNSGAFRQRLAAFRDWKLIAGRGDTIVFTDTAKTIALPPSPAAERAALQTAFMNCSVFSRLLESVVKGQRIQAQPLGPRAVHTLGVSPGTVERFMASFIESAIAAGLAEADNGEVIFHDPDDASEPAVSLENFEPAEGRSTEPPGRDRSSGVPPVVHQEWTLPYGTLVFEVRLDRPMPAGLFAQLGVVVQELEALADQLRRFSADPASD